MRFIEILELFFETKMTKKIATTTENQSIWTSFNNEKNPSSKSMKVEHQINWSEKIFKTIDQNVALIFLIPKRKLKKNTNIIIFLNTETSIYKKYMNQNF